MTRCIKAEVAKAGKHKRDTRTQAERQSNCWDETKREKIVRNTTLDFKHGGNRVDRSAGHCRR